VTFHPFLKELGHRLREARRARARSLADVAREAGVSRRYLTEAEAGRANPSAVVLARLSLALGTPLRELLDVPLRARSGERLALVGLRGAGKSTVGRRLARELEAPFVELDQRVEALAGLDLGAVFELQGADAFHRFEAEALEEVLAEGDRLVLAVGGSIVEAPATFDRLRGACRTVWLRAEPADHYRRVLEQGDARPMRDRPRAMEELEALLRTREPDYAQCELTVDTSALELDEVVRRIRDWIRDE